MSIRLTDAQLMALSSAAKREDRCIAIPANLKIGATQKLAAILIAAGLAKEIKAKADAAVWRRDEDTGQAYALKISAAGRKVIAVEDGAGPDAESEITASAPSAEDVAAQGAIQNSVSAVAAVAPRAGSKLATVVTLLQREGGATIAELASATQWLPHTTRAALTGLRKRGYGIGRREAKDARASAYIIADASPVAGG